MPSENNFKNLIGFFLSVDSVAIRQVIAKQIIESLHEIIPNMEDISLHRKALEVLAHDIRRYSGELPDMEREILRYEISLVTDIIT